MHPTPIFLHDDNDESLAFVSAHPFAVLAVNGEHGPVSALVPLVLDADRKSLLGHVARANPFWKAAQKSGKAMAIFRGPDGYVSPSAYASKKDHGRAVPTWNYIALEVRGDIDVETEPLNMAPYLEALTDQMEHGREEPWEITDAPEAYIAKLSRAIIGFRLSINKLTHVRKLSQNKSVADRAGVIASLETSALATDLHLANVMKQ